MTGMFHHGSRTLQDRFDTRRLADRIEEKLVDDAIDGHTIAFPNYNGNGMFLSMGNVLENPDVGLLFIDFERGHRLRLNGVASVDDDDPLLVEFPEAQFVVRVRSREVFPNCPRYIHRKQPVKRSPFVPREGCETPVPNWKRSDWAKGYLPRTDPARDPDATVI